MLNIIADHSRTSQSQHRGLSKTSAIRYCAGPTTPIYGGAGQITDDLDDTAEQMADEEFRLELEELIPQLRAFARSLCGKRDVADDLVQDAMLKAWAARDKYTAGTNMRAWVFIIMRNVFLSQKRRDRFKGEWNEEVAERTLYTAANQEKQLQVADLQRALTQLPTAQREALILIGAGGLSYEEASQVCGCAVGTVKSRVARARMALEHILSGDKCLPRSASCVAAAAAGDTILNEVARVIG